MTEDICRELDQNFDFFNRHLMEFLAKERGRFALLRHQSVEAFFDDAAEAELEGYRRFADGLFSVQEVNDRPVDLGYMNYAISAGASC